MLQGEIKQVTTEKVIVIAIQTVSVLQSDPTADEQKCQGDSDSDRIDVTEGDPDFSCVTQGDLNSTKRSRWEKAM